MRGGGGQNEVANRAEGRERKEKQGESRRESGKLEELRRSVSDEPRLEINDGSNQMS